MELLFVALGGATIGLIAHYALSGQVRRGIIALPAFATALISVLWEGLTWAGLAYGDFLIWGLSFAVTAIVVFGLGVVLGRRRTNADDAFFSHLSKTGRVA
ncbi:MAG: hypothetical protein JJE28_01490 [Actinomycetales bacterium]|nr:hypothetical protein [Actinomycetales bacterium]